MRNTGLDPDTQVIVTVESLAEALWYLGLGCQECSGTRTSETDAGRIIAALRGAK